MRNEIVITTAIHNIEDAAAIELENIQEGTADENEIIETFECILGNIESLRNELDI